MTTSPATSPKEAPAAFDSQGIESALAELVDQHLRDWPESIAAPARYALEGAGKRLRPQLCVAAYRSATGVHRDAPARGIFRIAAAVEVVHTYSLVHDDLPCMDDDDLRRGRASTHRAFDVPRAMVAGAALIPLACTAIVEGSEALGLAPEVRATLVAELCRGAGAGGMVGGQVLDLQAEGRELTLPELEAVHRRKTGALLASAVRIGALAGQARGEVLAAFDSFGRAVGLAFQIADDVLDVTGTATRLGKSAGRDAQLAKATYPGLLGVDEARRLAVSEVENGLDALRRAGVEASELETLAWYVVHRDR